MSRTADVFGRVARVGRRSARSLPAQQLLGAAFGAVQAGLVDQSLFLREVGPDDPARATAAPRTLVPMPQRSSTKG